MPEIELVFGSKAWLDHIFSSPPARVVKGRTKWTHRHAAWVEYLNRIAFVESRGELIGLLALEYLQKQGYVKRFKEQAFTTPLELWQKGLEALTKKGSKEYTPDLAAEDTTGSCYVIEIKTERYITRAMEEGFKLWKEKFAEHNLKYLLWTDRNGLTRHLRQNLLRLRRASAEYIERDEISRLVDTLHGKGPLPLWALYEKDFDLDLICHAAWHGKAHLPLLHPVSASTLITLTATENLADVLFGKEPEIEAWWNALEVA